MKYILTLVIAFVALGATAQTKYETGMRKAFELWKADKSDEAANLFERIAQAETDNWLPPFYVSQINVFQSFSEKDKEQLIPRLKKAQDFLNDAKAISKNNPEIMVLEAQLLTAWVVFDGQKYGMKYSGKIMELYNKAAEIAPENPRVALGKAEWEIGGAKWFGQPTEPYCKDLKRAATLFANFTPEGEFYPQGGESRVAQVLKENNCE
ncbi:hypothetical protein G5B37_00705 [Rasiella rasia]|uniref:Uncharacterized protein n=1 Tax=Rasiella rasia TaxID=2744027 RepID=A0A6G6GHS2_9FLAO|nr:hypothetical protein [Rasiella rasia]QIE58136.1 hypothetical protein G5B37_00705 [Rasiella rasia]